MGRIISFRGDAHHETQLLLPWYVKGRLDPDDHARVEAHLAACAECAAELELEQALASEVADLPVDADDGWTRLRDRMVADRTASRRPTSGRLGRAATWSALAASLCLAALLAVMTFRSLEAPRYQTLGARPAGEAGSLMVVFRPEAREADLRRILVEAHLRLVDGPTAGGAYVLRAPPAERDAALAALRRQPEVVLAEPIDAGTGRR
ncbi:zf-HC2 domain-containing protein [Phenylobacterium sp. LjRoot225]|uniref:zf-HC2 domain-containing protein n=1 Tax=Phenylobacterium sp. LjRoot225 TaxID=3342285 RepID=UPI003ECFB847